MCDDWACFEIDIGSIQRLAYKKMPGIKGADIFSWLKEYVDHGLLFVWANEHNDNEFGYWTGAEEGRLPSPTRRRKRRTPEPPSNELASYLHKDDLPTEAYKRRTLSLPTKPTKPTGAYGSLPAPTKPTEAYGSLPAPTKPTEAYGSLPAPTKPTEAYEKPIVELSSKFSSPVPSKSGRKEPAELLQRGCSADAAVMKQKCSSTLHSPSSVPKVTNTCCKCNKVFEESEREYKAAVYLHNKILEILPNLKKPNLQKWAVDFDKIFRIDKRPADEVKRLIDFIYADDFWQAVVQSPVGLRKNYDKALAQMARQSKEVSTSSTQEALECKQAYLKQGVTCVNYRNGEKKYDYCIHCSW